MFHYYRIIDRNRNIQKHRNHHGVGAVDYYTAGNGSSKTDGGISDRHSGTGLLQSPSSSIASGRSIGSIGHSTSMSSNRALQGRTSYTHIMGGTDGGGNSSGSERWNHNRDR